jgi:hypothetical protein
MDTVDLLRSSSLLADEATTSADFTSSLRETMLQDPSDLADEAPLVAEVATLLCFELAYSTPMPWHYGGYNALFFLYITPHGKQSLQNLALHGGLIEDLARRTFEM